MSLFQTLFRRIGLLLLFAAVLSVACGEDLKGVRDTGTRRSALRSSGDVPVVTSLRREFPGARLKMRNRRVNFIDGAHLALGDTPEQSAEAVKASVARAFNINPNDLVPQRLVEGGRMVLKQPEPTGLMYNHKTETFKFWLYRYGQQVAGIPVHKAELKVLVWNKPGYPVASAISSLRNISRFVVPATQRSFKVNRDNSLRAAQSDVSKNNNRIGPASLDVFSEPELVVFAGSEDDDVPPRLAIRYTGETTRGLGRWQFVADAANGEILNTEDRIYFTNVWGRVMGNVTLEPVAADCAPQYPVPLPFAEVSIDGGAEGFTGPNGFYFLNNPNSTPVNVVSTLDGKFIDINYWVHDVETLTSTVTPPGPAFFLQNQADDNEYVIAQANAYYHVNLVRNTLLHYSPDYPIIPTQEDFEVLVNADETYMDGGACPAGAWYEGHGIGIGYIVLCASGSKSWGGDVWVNTAFGTIIYHEYAHHILGSGDSMQNEFGEGFADAVAILIAGDPGYGRGYLLGDCSSVMRNADNNCQYDPVNCTTDPIACGDHEDLHGCGKLFSGIIWDLREALMASHPTDYLDILYPLLFDYAQYNEGTGAIDEYVLTFMLELDDDDNNLDNGTPHSAEICKAFEAHGFECPISSARPCDGICANPVVFNWSASYQSQDLQTGEVCRETTQDVTGGNCGNMLAPRTLSVNGTVMTCDYQEWRNLPPKRNGGYCITTTSGDYPYAFFTFW
ncbi:MAG: hypothetical protein JXR76_20195 [Deltaproteobacteria bacterium]|nr:hypothetical protein [Deltaproteobacteria bacterium]